MEQHFAEQVQRWFQITGQTTEANIAAVPVGPAANTGGHEIQLGSDFITIMAFRSTIQQGSGQGCGSLFSGGIQQSTFSDGQREGDSWNFMLFNGRNL